MFVHCSNSSSDILASAHQNTYTCMVERMCCRLLVFIHFRRGSSSFSFSSSSCGLSSLAISSKVFIVKLLSMAIQQVCYIFRCNSFSPSSCASLLTSFSSVLLWLKSRKVVHKFWEKFPPHSIQTVHLYFFPCCIDFIKALKNVE